MTPQLPARGFTLVELVVTLIIVGIVAATAYPRFANQQGFQSRAFFEQVQEGIKFAQKAAIAQRKRVFVTISATSIQACYTAVCGGGCVAGDECRYPREPRPDDAQAGARDCRGAAGRSGTDAVHILRSRRRQRVD